MLSVSVAFVDDHPTLLEGIRAIFLRRPRYKVIATGSCCADAIKIALERKPNILVIDLNMPGNAFDCIAQIRKISPETKIIAFTASSDINHAIDALQAGATGYVLKGSPLGSVTEAIDAAMAGDTYISKGFSTKVISELANPKVSGIKLSLREEQIISLLLESRTNREIANQMNLSEKTIKNYMSLLMQKLMVRNRVGLVMAARSLPLAGARRRDVDRIGLLN
ncbi:MAG: response regulator transcription factor [Devosia sp.]|uniref:response regulator n=1 Tax=Devosia sp. TaxID=1871048 RepID=UPI001ACC1C54|nr:response regulator transcription factor [Devosia sp.]MBN9314141.1 response regulator transcription factor [Devosia sp.]